VPLAFFRRKGMELNFRAREALLDVTLIITVAILAQGKQSG